MKSKLSKKFGPGVIVLMLTVLTLPAMAAAFGPGDGSAAKGFHFRDHREAPLGIWRNLQLVQGLDLTTEQIKQLKDADFTFCERHLVLKAKIASLRLQIDKAFSEDVVDDTTVLSLAEKISVAKGKLFVQKIKARLAMGTLLNADQIEKLKRHDLQQNQKHRDGRHPFERTGNKKRIEN